MIKTNQAEGFYCGKTVFQKLVDGFNLKPIVGEIKSFTYDGMSFFRDDIAEGNTIAGVGHPYADIAKEMEEHFKEKEE